MSRAALAVSQALPWFGLALVAWCLLAFIGGGASRWCSKLCSTTLPRDVDPTRHKQEATSRRVAHQRPETIKEAVPKEPGAASNQQQLEQVGKHHEETQQSLGGRLQRMVDKLYDSSGTILSYSKSEGSRHSLECLGSERPIAKQTPQETSPSAANKRQMMMSNDRIKASELGSSSLHDGSVVGLDDTSMTGTSETEQEEEEEEEPLCVVELHPAPRNAEKSELEEPKRQPKRSTCSVSFSTICIHSHAITLGNNPSVSSGAPVAIGSECIDTRTFSVDDYEAARPPTRTSAELKMPPGIRQRMLREAGVSYVDLMQCVQVCDTMRFQLQQSVAEAKNAPDEKAPTTTETEQVKNPLRKGISKRLLRLFSKSKMVG